MSISRYLSLALLCSVIACGGSSHHDSKQPSDLPLVDPKSGTIAEPKATPTPIPTPTKTPLPAPQPLPIPTPEPNPDLPPSYVSVTRYDDSIASFHLKGLPKQSIIALDDVSQSLTFQMEWAAFDKDGADISSNYTATAFPIYNPLDSLDVILNAQGSQIETVSLLFSNKESKALAGSMKFQLFKTRKDLKAVAADVLKFVRDHFPTAEETRELLTNLDNKGAAWFTDFRPAFDFFYSKSYSKNRSLKFGLEVANRLQGADWLKIYEAAFDFCYSNTFDTNGSFDLAKEVADKTNAAAWLNLFKAGYNLYYSKTYNTKDSLAFAKVAADKTTGAPWLEAFEAAYNYVYSKTYNKDLSVNFAYEAADKANPRAWLKKYKAAYEDFYAKTYNIQQSLAFAKSAADQSDSDG